MALNKQALYERLDKMFWLPIDWDGFNSVPITKTAHDVAKRLIEFIDVDVSIRLFVATETEGGVYCEVTRARDPKCNLELTVLPDGKMEYVEVRGADVISEGDLTLTPEAVNEILR